MNILILECIFLFVTPIMASAQSNGDPEARIHTARVIAPKAVVYSDELMNAPIGYIANDKFIHVGNPRKSNPDLLPIIIYGRIAFIEAKNVHFEEKGTESQNSKRGAPREHNIDIILDKPEEKLFENNSVFFNLQQFSGGEETRNLFAAVDGSDKENYLGYGVDLIHRQIPGRLFWGAGFEYNVISSSNINFGMFLVRPLMGFTPLRTSLFLVDLHFALDLSLNGQLKISNNTMKEPSAFVWGPHIGARIVFFPDLKYHVHGGVAYRGYRVIGIETLYDSNDAAINGIKRINAVDISLGFSFEI